MADYVSLIFSRRLSSSQDRGEKLSIPQLFVDIVVFNILIVKPVFLE